VFHRQSAPIGRGPGLAPETAPRVATLSQANQTPSINLWAFGALASNEISESIRYGLRMAIDLHLVEHALALAHHRSFARASKALHVSQPTLSRGIAALEDSLGVRLFDRGQRGVEPTVFGRLLLERGALLLADDSALRREIQQLAGLESGELQVGAGPFSAEISVGRAMTRLLAKHPRVRARVARLDPEQVVRDVLAGRCELGVADTGPLGRDARLHHEPLPRHPINLFARPDHPLAGHANLCLADVLAFPIVGSRVRGATAGRLPAEGPAGRFDPDTGDFLPAITVDSLDLGRRIAASTVAILPTARGTVLADLREGRLAQLAYHEPWMETNYELFWRSDRTPSPALRAFVEEIRSVESELSAAEAGAVRAPESPTPRAVRVNQVQARS
jgi:DNA-binding transcriptional LysR family regulator